MKWMIAGLGSIGRRHLRNLLDLGEDEILLFRTHHSTLPDDELTGLPVETDLQKALATHPDVVVISNPTSAHLDIAIPAAQTGCHLLLEKPISHSLARIDELRQAVDQGGGSTLVGFHYRFHPGLQQLARWLIEEKVGRPLSVRVQWGEYLPNWHPWEDYRASYSARSDLGGGVVLTLCHPLDYLRWLLGDVDALWAFTGRVSDLEINVEDVAEIGLRFRRNVVGSVHLDYYRRPGTHQLEITCTGGSLSWDNTDGAARALDAASGEWEIILPPQGFVRNDLFLAEMRHMRMVARGEDSPLCTLEDGVIALQLALAVHQSSAEQRMVTPY
ncbi:MAG: Gfo/Idh/MocA family oxidoreductase [Anaerolineaceae bacterium]|nr:Gfo/Idh/MocA family oxidoreductase [Anaerolineaceae bacterium]